MSTLKPEQLDAPQAVRFLPKNEGGEYMKLLSRCVLSFILLCNLSGCGIAEEPCCKSAEYPRGQQEINELLASVGRAIDENSEIDGCGYYNLPKLSPEQELEISRYRFPELPIVDETFFKPSYLSAIKLGAVELNGDVEWVLQGLVGQPALIITLINDLSLFVILDDKRCVVAFPLISTYD